MSTWQDKRDAHFANIGNWQQYEDASLEDFTNVLNADPWYAARLAGYANDVANNDYHGMMQYNLEFTPSSGATARGHELTNRYIALMNQGYTNQEIMGAAYGNDGSSWAAWDMGESDGGRIANPEDNPGGPTTERPPTFDPSVLDFGRDSGGFMSGYANKRKELELASRNPYNSNPSPPAGPQPPVTISDPAMSQPPRGKFLDSYGAQREELANRPSVMSLFKEMKDYEQPPQ